MHDGDIIQLQYGKSSGPALLTHPSKSRGMLKQIISQGILLALIILLGSSVAACNSQPEPYPTYIPYPTYTPAATGATPSARIADPQSTPSASNGAAPGQPAPTAEPIPTQTPTPIAEESLFAEERFTTISNGDGHTCVLRSDGSPLCWGSSVIVFRRVMRMGGEPTEGRSRRVRSSSP